MPQKDSQFMKKHSYNIFPEASPEDFNRLLEDIRNNGFDRSQPITTYHGEILDGWNRFKACEILNIKPEVVEFFGTLSEAVAFVMRTNKRRNLNKGQWACIAAEAEDLLFAIGQEAKKNQGKRNDLIQDVADAVKQGKIRPLVAGEFIERADKGNLPQNFGECSKHSREAATKAAELFNTNRTYVNQAVKMKEKAPEVFEKVKAGKMTMQDAQKEVARKPEGSKWLPDEIERREQVEKGESVVANFERDKHLIEWAGQNGKLCPVNRGTRWGNPFLIGADGDRDAVCDCYETHYVTHKPSFEKFKCELQGKVLACHCYPERCHAETLVTLFT